MLIAPIDERFRASPAYRDLRRRLRSGAHRHRATNLTGSSKGVLAAALAEDLERPVLVVAPTADRAEAWLGDLESLLGETRIGYYPQWEILPYEDRAPQREIVGRRLEFLAGLLDGTVTVGVTSARAVVQKIPAPAALADRLVRIAAGHRIDREELLERLVSMGFEREAMVAEVGTFSVRGGIVDVFSYRYENPVRIELVGDEVASIRSFDLATQRSVESLERVEILPAKERPGGPAESLDAEAEGPLRALTDYLHPDTLLLVDEPSRTGAVWSEAWEEVVRRHGEALEHGIDAPPPETLWLDADAIAGAVEPFGRVSLYGLHMAGPGDDPEGPATRFVTREPEPVRRSIKRLAEVLRHDRSAGIEPVILCDNLGQRERLEELLPKDVRREASLVVGSLEAGFRMTDAALAVYTDHEIFARRRRLRRRRRYAAAKTTLHLTQIQPGDYLVHLDYGIGRYEGLERLALSGEGEVEALRIAYAEEEVLYLPVEQLGRVEKFTSEDGKTPSLHRMGSGRWERQKAKTKEAIAELADELLALHAKREVAEGFAFSEDTAWQREMESAFLYEDTPDQRAASEAVKRDMERPKPMDRLVCGDVGYGKTEVAMRAAFKAVQDGKQVAVMVPTTILAVQHLETFRERLADFPVRIEALSRFNTPAEAREILDGVANGTVDIVIGTHRLLSPDVSFADLGLIVVDEEQRFGVRHKERFRQFVATVDVLTLSATPIPRTLQMSLMGLRDMSLIETAPRDRTPIVTWVAEFDEEIVEEAIRRELDRGGQVFFVHNRVRSIDVARRIVERIVPEARVTVSHGQMPERELEEAMMGLFHGEVEVLVTTAIIESGLDVPNANTMVVHRADRFGMADLYQLRGRVGRSHRRAYCYLLTPPRESLSREAEKRLRVLEEHTDLGAGYAIALHDLEMRGAGNLLGADQSGFIAAVGFETYLRLLEETVGEIRGSEAAPSLPELGYDADAYLPTSYVPDDQQKLALYRRLARLQDVVAIDDFADELADRYGPLPDPARHLVTATRLKALGTAAGLARLRIRPLRGEAELRWPAGVEPKLKAIQTAAGERDVEVTVRQVAPLHLRLSAGNEATLLEALEEGLRAWSPDRILTC